MITVRVRDREVNALPLRHITSGSVGLPCAFSFDEAWEGLSKIATFRGSGAAVDVALLTDDCAVPAEVLATAGGDLFIGVYGANGAGTIVIPTIWVNAGYIYEGTEPSGVDPAEPTPSWVAQVQGYAEAAAASAQEAISHFGGTIYNYTSKRMLFFANPPGVEPASGVYLDAVVSGVNVDDWIIGQSPLTVGALSAFRVVGFFESGAWFGKPYGTQWIQVENGEDS